jgi:cobalt-precorrin 5A hydrolase/precorrin-3B C17-methyltransferase
VIGLVHATRAGRLAAERAAAAWPDAVVYTGSVGEQLRAAWGECDGIVCFLATGATVRLAAPLLTGKGTDPAVVCVDEAQRYAIALLGGHAPARTAAVAGGAATDTDTDIGAAGAPASRDGLAGGGLAGGGNALAERVAALLGAEPVITTASDRTGTVALGGFGADLGFRIEDRAPLAAVGRALLDGEPVRYLTDATWPVPPLPANVSPHARDARHAIVVTDRAPVASGGEPVAGGGEPAAGGGEPHQPAAAVVYRPPSLVVGVGASRGVRASEVGSLVDAALRDAGLSPRSVRHVATVAAKADERGILDAAAERGWPVVAYPAAELSTVDVPNPSEVVRAEVGTPSVAEAAALYGGRSELVVTKRKSAMATVAVARHAPRGRLTIVGIGPGAPDLVTPRAAAALRRASVVVGLDQYVDQVRHLVSPGARVLATGLGQEEERARSAVIEASAGHAVALVGSGDAGVYAMASPALELAGDDVDVHGVPGITAAVAAAHALGAPLGHDHAYVSLSDLHTPWPAIERRVRAAAEGDFVVCLYNPRSRGRDWQLPAALDLLARHRPDGTPVGLVRNATRGGERVELTTLAALRAGGCARVDMMTVVLVGCSQTRVIAGRMVTPRGYRWLGEDA